MTEDHRYRLIFEEFLDKTEDGFIVVDKDGIITDINQNYCDFLAKRQEDVIGKPIGQVITTTSMYDVLARRHRGDGSNGVYIQPYCAGETRDQSENYAVANRFCFFDEDSTLLGAAAHMKFRQRAMDTAKEILDLELKYYREEYSKSTSGSGGFEHLIGKDPKLLELKRTGTRIAQTDFSVLITGETGTGKEVLAKAIHAESPRRDGPFICVNCGAIPDNLLESELFGYEEGAFTGANREGKMGVFESANKGTVFLDEIGDLPLDMQVHLLRVLQERQVKRVGGVRSISVDVRIVAATNRDLLEMVREKTFREDLYYRLNVVPIQIPPLRERKGDIKPLIQSFLTDMNKKYRFQKAFTPAAMEVMHRYAWPGNVRELKNVVEQAVILSSGDYILPTDLPITSRHEADSDGGTLDLRLAVAQFEYDHICLAYQKYRNVRAAAASLGMDDATFVRKRKKYEKLLQK